MAEDRITQTKDYNNVCKCIIKIQVETDDLKTKNSTMGSMKRKGLLFEKIKPLDKLAT